MTDIPVSSTQLGPALPPTEELLPQPGTLANPEEVGDSLGEVDGVLPEIEPVLTEDTKAENIDAVVPEPKEPETLVKDIDEAREGAYAEKPFQDAKIEKVENLTPQDQETLSWLSSDAAETAMAKYRESKTTMSESEAAIREKFESLKILAKGTSEAYLRNNIDFHISGLSDEEKQVRIDLAGKLLAETVDIQLDEIMADDSLSDREKLSAAGSIAYTQKVAEFSLGLGSGGGNYREAPGELEHQFSHHSDEVIIALMWGKFAASLVSSREAYAADALDIIAKRSGKPYDEVFEKVKASIEQTITSVDSMTSGYFVSLVEKHGYLWSASKKQFVKVSS